MFAIAMVVMAASSLQAQDKPAATTQPARKEMDLELFEEGTSWAFIPGAEFPGAKGSFKLGMEKDKPVGILSYDFSGGGNYVGALTAVRISDTAGEVRFKVQAREAMSLGVRLTDQTGQVHQYGVPYTTPGQWATMRVSLRKPDAGHWAGKNDGEMYYPISEICLNVGNVNLTDKQGQVLFCDVVTIEKKPAQP
jgi:hypothetical protein